MLWGSCRLPASYIGIFMSVIKSCKGCVPPKRFPGCWGTCEVYKKQRAQYDAEVQAYRNYVQKDRLVTDVLFAKNKK